MPLSETAVLDALRTVHYPGYSRDIVSLGVVRALRVGTDIVEFEIVLGPAPAGVAEPIRQAALAAVQALDGAKRVRVMVRDAAGSPPSLKLAGAAQRRPNAPAPDSGLIPQVAHTVAVASGKGGVGKSTIAVNLAVALAQRGLRTGLLDADVYGPSIPLMTGIDRQPDLTADRRLIPFERFGVRIMSIGFLVDKDSAVIWRGPMLVKALEQLLRDVEWGQLDCLIIDMPPGTGDVQLTLAQKVKLSGSIIVTTPQDVALADARKGVAMFRKVNVPILGLVENMSYFECPHCSGRSEVFGHGGGKAEAKKLDVPFLGEVPLDPAVRIAADRGQPLVVTDPDSPRSAALREIAGRLCKALDYGNSATDAPSGTGLLERFRRIVSPSVKS